MTGSFNLFYGVTHPRILSPHTRWILLRKVWTAPLLGYKYTPVTRWWWRRLLPWCHLCSEDRNLRWWHHKQSGNWRKGFRPPRTTCESASVLSQRFQLRKRVSNFACHLPALLEGQLVSPVFLLESQQPQFSIMGLHWSPSTDYFTYSLNLPCDPRPIKWTVLSLITKIFDPCGFLSAWKMIAKCFMQFLSQPQNFHGINPYQLSV